MNKNVATISHNECKDVLLNKKYMRYSMYRIQSSKDHKIGTYEISKIFCVALMINTSNIFNDKYILDIHPKQWI